MLYFLTTVTHEQGKASPSLNAVTFIESFISRDTESYRHAVLSEIFLFDR